jgi:hypothetical protein
LLLYKKDYSRYQAKIKPRLSLGLAMAMPHSLMDLLCRFLWAIVVLLTENMHNKDAKWAS